MIRVKIRSFREEFGKVLRFDESIEYHSLLRKIIDKLGLIPHREIGDDDLSQLFQLRLGGDSVLEDTNEIEHGDELVLMRIDEMNCIEGRCDRKSTKPLHRATAESNQKRNQTSPATEIKKENTDDEKNDDDEEENFNSKPAAKVSQDSKSIDADTKTRQIKKANRPVDDRDVISISSDEDESLEDNGSDYWEEEDPSSSSDEDNTNFDHDEAEAEETSDAPPSKKRKRNSKPPLESPLEVIMDEKEVPSAPGKQYEQVGENEASNDDLIGASLLVNKAGKKADQVVKDRIIKLLNTGFHDQSNEHEAKNAMKLAQRLMRKHNLSQALLLKEREDKNDQSAQNDEVLKGGMVRVRIINRKTRKPSLYARWISQLTHPVCENFDVKSYNQTRRCVRCDVVLYGIYANAQLAAYAFKVATERIAQMSAEYKPKKTSRNMNTKSSRLSYALGIVQGISEDIKKNLQMEKEKSQRKLERARVAGTKGEAYEESDDEDMDHEAASYSFPKSDDRNSYGNNDCNDIPPSISSNHESGESDQDQNKESKPKPISGIDLRHRLEELEEEQQAALVLVNHNEKIAEEVLKEHDIKLKSGRKRKAIDFDRHSYDKGIEDSKEIDMNQRAIRDEVKVKNEL